MIVINHDIPTCPACNGSVIPRDSRKRIVKDVGGGKLIYSLRRYYCPRCNKIHLEIPSEIIPYKHYSRQTIEGVKDGSIDYCSADNKTLYRWKK